MYLSQQIGRLNMPIFHSTASFLLALTWDETERIIDLKDTIQPYFEPTQPFEIVLFTKMRRPKNNFHIPSRVSIVSQSDFSLFGRLKTKKKMSVNQMNFDVGLVLNPLDKRQIKLLQSLSIRHVVSFDEKIPFADIKLTANGQQRDEKLTFAKKMLLKISSNK